MENNLFLDFTHNCVFCKRNEILPKINVEQKMKEYIKNKMIQSKEKDAIAIQNISHCIENYLDGWKLQQMYMENIFQLI